jgi:predicted outer membrane repeat protein
VRLLFRYSPTAIVGGSIVGGALSVTNSTFTGNSSPEAGGALYAFEGTLTVTSSTFVGNSASFGGGIYANFGTAIATNSTFAKNSASAC